jgi:hypothetical protein
MSRNFSNRQFRGVGRLATGLCRLRLVGLLVIGLYLLHGFAKLCNSTHGLVAYGPFAIREILNVLISKSFNRTLCANSISVLIILVQIR